MLEKKKRKLLVRGVEFHRKQVGAGERGWYTLSVELTRVKPVVALNTQRRVETVLEAQWGWCQVRAVVEGDDAYRLTPYQLRGDDDEDVLG